MFLLKLNDMRSHKFEILVPVAIVKSKEAAVAVIHSQTVEVYKDKVGANTWHKSFKKGGPLEWYNQWNPGNLIDHLEEISDTICGGVYVMPEDVKKKINERGFIFITKEE